MEAKPYAILGGWGVQESADPQRQRPLHLQVMQVTLSFLSSTTFALHNVKPAAGFMKCRPAWAYPTSTRGRCGRGTRPCSSGKPHPFSTRDGDTPTVHSNSSWPSPLGSP